MRQISAEALKPLLTDGEEIAFLDVREHGQYGEGHPFFSVSLPYSQIEDLAAHLMPRKTVRCVVMDAGDDVGSRAARVLENLGYTNVSILTGGAPGWAGAGYTLFKGVNVPSKTFGEMVEHAFDTPSISAEELNDWFGQEKKHVLLDGRTSKEFHKMSIPNASYCPNAELGYRLSEFCDDPDIPIVINCAGRTRSIIGAQSLRLIDIPNPVYALRNGTQGWRLSGFDLVHGADPGTLPTPDMDTQAAGRARAEEMRAKYGIQTVTGEDASAWLNDTARSTYLLDVRTAEEYNAGHAAGARSAPGGQLVQATDEQVAVRNARIILCCDTGLRATTTAIWLAGMGHQVWVLDPDTRRDDTISHGLAKPDNPSTIEAEQLKPLIDQGTKVIDASNGLDYRSGHIDGSLWRTRARLTAEDVSDLSNLVLVGQSALLLHGLIAEVESLTGNTPQNVHLGSPEDWRTSGLNVVETPNDPTEEDCIDYLFFVHDRHDGNLESARRYLEWETGLMDQLDDQERGVLTPLS